MCHQQVRVFVGVTYFGIFVGILSSLEGPLRGMNHQPIVTKGCLLSPDKDVPAPLLRVIWVSLIARVLNSVSFRSDPRV